MTAPTTSAIDTARLGVMLNELRLPTIKTVWPEFATRADREGWPAARFLAAIAGHEIAARDRRRIERDLAEARLPPGKSLDTFDFDPVPKVSKAQIRAVAAGGAWLATGANLLLFGPPGGKSHPAALGPAPRRERLEGARHAHQPTSSRIGRREFALDTALNRPDRSDTIADATGSPCEAVGWQLLRWHVAPTTRLLCRREQDVIMDFSGDHVPATIALRRVAYLATSEEVWSSTGRTREVGLELRDA